MKLHQKYRRSRLTNTLSDLHRDSTCWSLQHVWDIFHDFTWNVYGQTGDRTCVCVCRGDQQLSQCLWHEQPEAVWYAAGLLLWDVCIFWVVRWSSHTHAHTKLSPELESVGYNFISGPYACKLRNIITILFSRFYLNFVTEEIDNPVRWALFLWCCTMYVTDCKRILEMTVCLP